MSGVIVHFGRFGNGLVPVFEQAVSGERFVPLPTDPADGVPEDCDVVVTLTYDIPDLRRTLGPGVRWVHVFGAGVDGFPFDELGPRTLTCSRGASAPAIAEFVLATMLAFEKRLPEVWLTEPPEQWNVPAGGLGGLRERVLGLVGLGAIGVEVARRALAMDMRVVALRRTTRPAPIAGVEIVSTLAELVGEADHVVVAAPATADTHRLFGASAFASFKPGAHFVNVARGTLVDQDALLAALEGGHVAMASLDVVDPEPLPAGHPLYRHPRVRLSPHVSWSSPDTITRTIELFVANLRRYRAGEPLDGVVDIHAGY